MPRQKPWIVDIVARFEGQQGIAQPAARMVVDEPATLAGGMARLGRQMAKLAQFLAQAQAELGGGALSEGNDQDLLHARAVIEQQLDHQVLKQVCLAGASRRLDHGMPVPSWSSSGGRG